MIEYKEQAYALLNAWTTCDTSQMAASLDPSFVEIDSPQPDASGLAGLREKIEAFHKGHQKVRLRGFKQIAAGEVVCTEWLLSACVVADGASGDDAQKTVWIPGISWTYFADGKIVKNRVYRDIVGYLLQRGYRWVPTVPNPGDSPTHSKVES